MATTIKIQYKNDISGEYGGDEYSYLCDLPVNVGDLVIAPTKNGDATARVSQVDIPLSKVSAKVRPLLKTVTEYAEDQPSDGIGTLYEKAQYNTTALIEVKQLPIIEDQLRKVRESIESRVNEVLSLACTDETYKEVKRARAELNKERTALEERRMEVKRTILAPYERFEALYKECAGDIYANADKQLKERITEVEDGLRREKNDDIEAYFSEYAKSKEIPDDLISLKKSGIKVGMAESKKSLQRQVASFIDRVSDELALIETQEHKDEIFLEYKATLNMARSISSVTARHLAIMAERQRREERAEEDARNAAAREKTEAVISDVMAPKEPETISPPTEAPAPDSPAAEASPEGQQDKRYRVSFAVIGTLDQLKELKKFMNERGLDYEQLG